MISAVKLLLATCLAIFVLSNPALGQLVVLPGETFNLPTGTSTFPSVTNDGQIIFTPIGDPLVNDSSATTLDFTSTTATLAGTGELVLTDRFDSVISVQAGGSQTVTNAAGHTIRGTGVIRIGSGDTFINEGQISVEAGGLQVDGNGSPETFTNNGVIDVADGETIEFFSLNNVTDFGTINLGAGSTALLSASTLNNSTINAGNQITLDTGVTSVGGTLNNNGVVTLSPIGDPLVNDSSATTLDFTSTAATLAGTGELVLTDRFDSLIDANSSGSQTVTNGASHTIRGTGEVQIGSSDTFVNAGQINVEVGGIQIDGQNTTSTFTNNGVIDVADGETIEFFSLNNANLNVGGEGNVIGTGTVAFDSSTFNTLLDPGFDNSINTVDIEGNLSLTNTPLGVTADPGFAASLGDVFDVATIGGTLTGQFSNFGEGDLVGNFGEDLFITFAGGDGNDIALVATLTPGSVNFLVADPTDSAFFTGTRTPAPGGGGGGGTTITLDNLDLLPGSEFTLGVDETLDLGGDGVLFIDQGATFISNGVINGNIVNTGNFFVPISFQPGGSFEIPISSNSGTITTPVGGLGSVGSAGGTVVVSGGGSTGPIGGGGGITIGGGTNVEFQPSPTPGTPGTTVIEGPVSVEQGSNVASNIDASTLVTGDYAQEEGAAFTVAIAGTEQGVTHSFLGVEGSADLAGSILLVLQPELFSLTGYTPEIGDTFDFIEAEGGITLDPELEVLSLVTAAGASFLTNQGFTLTPAIGPGDEFFIESLGPLFAIDQPFFEVALTNEGNTLTATLVASVIPEPSTICLAFVAAVSGAVCRRRGQETARGKTLPGAIGLSPARRTC